MILLKALMNIGAVFGPLIGIFVGAICIGLFWVDVNVQDEVVIFFLRFVSIGI